MAVEKLNEKAVAAALVAYYCTDEEWVLDTYSKRDMRRAIRAYLKASREEAK